MPKHALRRRRRNRRIFCNLIDGGAAPVPAQVQVWYQNRRQRERSQGTKGAAEMLVRRAHEVGFPFERSARLISAGWTSFFAFSREGRTCWWGAIDWCDRWLNWWRLHDVERQSGD